MKESASTNKTSGICSLFFCCAKLIIGSKHCFVRSYRKAPVEGDCIYNPMKISLTGPFRRNKIWARFILKWHFFVRKDDRIVCSSHFSINSVIKVYFFWSKLLNHRLRERSKTVTLKIFKMCTLKTSTLVANLSAIQRNPVFPYPSQNVFVLYTRLIFDTKSAIHFCPFLCK